MFEAMLEAGWRSEPVSPSQWIQDWAIRRYGTFSKSVSEGMATLLDAAYSNPIDTSSIEKVPEVLEASEPGYSQNTNATGMVFFFLF